MLHTSVKAIGFMGLLSVSMVVFAAPKPAHKTVPSSAIELQCRGFHKLAGSNKNYIFKIDPVKLAWTGTEDSISQISGQASVNDDLILATLTNNVGTTVFFIDRNAGTFKADITTKSGLLLIDNVNGTCSKFSGKAF